ncbi:MAG TPA: TadE/TadG family type IV pilus assembly protein [Gemmataceae bacterium]|nr:TadE/TadG family type IV pilus assembly protein [Gemmataceae bacterium]
MRFCPDSCPGGRRRGATAVELAILLPFLAFILVAAVDFARVYYHYLTITNCARCGALYGSRDPKHAADEAGIKAAALADAANLSPIPEVASRTGTDPAGHPCIEVTVTYPFQTVTKYPGIPSSITLKSTVQMRIAPELPKNS